jgi:signal transduction histidine kinase
MLRARQLELRLANEALREAQGRILAQHAELEQKNAQLAALSQQAARQNDQLAAASQELNRAASELAHTNQHQAELLAKLSHDLRKPLNSALILSKMLADNHQQNLTPEQVKFARSIYSAGNEILELTNQILVGDLHGVPIVADPDNASPGRHIIQLQATENARAGAVDKST